MYRGQWLSNIGQIMCWRALPRGPGLRQPSLVDRYSFPTYSVPSSIDDPLAPQWLRPSSVMSPVSVFLTKLRWIYLLWLMLGLLRDGSA